MTYRGPMGRAVGASLNAGKIGRRDEAAAALARRYAALIDAAVPSARYAEHIAAVRAALDTLNAAGLIVGVDYDKHWQKITEALAAHSVASDLGPKLLAALTSLGLTLAGRGAKGGTNDAPSAPVEQSTTDRLREQRAKRAGAGRAAAVDSAAT